MRQRGQKWRTWEMAGLFAALLLGNTLHFVYDWTGQARWAAYLAATNESTWEHLKLLFFPMLLLTLVELFFFHEKMPANCLWARTLGILSGMIFIVAVFYTLNGILGKKVQDKL